MIRFGRSGVWCLAGSDFIASSRSVLTTTRPDISAVQDCDTNGNSNCDTKWVMCLSYMIANKQYCMVELKYCNRSGSAGGGGVALPLRVLPFHSHALRVAFQGLEKVVMIPGVWLLKNTNLLYSDRPTSISMEVCGRLKVEAPCPSLT